MFPQLVRGALALGRGLVRGATGVAGAALRTFGGAGLGYRERADAAGKPLDEWSINHLRTQNAGAIQRMLDGLTSRTDTFVHSISVKVRGGPAGDLRSAYYLALSACFGRYARSFSRIDGGYFEMGCHTDVTRKEVTVTVGHRTGIMGDLVRASRRFGGGVQSARGPYDVMFEGPDQVTVGAGWVGPFSGGATGTYAANDSLTVQGGFVGSAGTTVPPYQFGVDQVPQTVLPGGQSLGTGGVPSTAWVLTVDESVGSRLPAVLVRQFKPQAWRLIGDPFRELPQEQTGIQNMFLRRHAPLIKNRLDYVTVVRADKAQMPVLPDDGRVITTGETRNPLVQPPRPPVDGMTRGDWLTAVAQTLTNPGYLPSPPPRDPQAPVAASGLRIREPGTVTVGVAPQLLQPPYAATSPTRTNPPPPTSLGAAVGGVAFLDPPAPPTVPVVQD